MRNQAKMKAADEAHHQQKAEEARGAVDFYGKAGLNIGVAGDNQGALPHDAHAKGPGAGNVLGQAAAPKTPVVERSDRKVGPLSGLGNHHEEPRRQNTVQSHKAGSPLTSAARGQDGRVTSNPASNRHAQQQQPPATKNPNIIKQNNFFTPSQASSANQAQGQPTMQRRTTSPKPPQNPGSGHNYPLQGANFNKNNTQIFQNKTLGGIGSSPGASGGAQDAGSASGGPVYGGASSVMGLSDRKGSESGLGKEVKAKDGSMHGAAGASGRKDAPKSEHEAKQGQSQPPK